MKKYQKIYLILSIIIFLGVCVFALFTYFYPNRQINKLNINPIVNNDKGIQVFSPEENEIISSPLKITGVANGLGWIGFEGQVGTVKLFDSNGKELGLAILTAKGEWMQQKIDFETAMSFFSLEEQEGSLVFYNENPSGEPERNKTFTVPVKLTNSSSERTKVKVYFNNITFNEDYTCEKVFAIEREIPKTQQVARRALEELLSGPTESEKNIGFSTNINPGVKIQSLSIDDKGVARVDFSEELDRGVAGSCRVLGIRSQITETLKQFPTVKDVVISVNRETETILQP